VGAAPGGERRVGRGGRCPSLRTLVLLLGPAPEDGSAGDEAGVTAEVVACALAAAAGGAPHLRTVQLVLDAEDWRCPSTARALWAALARLPRLAALTLGWAFHGAEAEARMGEDMAACLDEVAQPLAPAPCALWSCRPGDLLHGDGAEAGGCTREPAGHMSAALLGPLSCSPVFCNRDRLWFAPAGRTPMGQCRQTLQCLCMFGHAKEVPACPRQCRQSRRGR